MLKRLAIIALLSTTLISAKPKTYTFQVDEKAQAGKTQLEPGRYRLRLDGSNITLINKAGKAIEATIKLESASQTYSETSVTATKKEGVTRIDSVALGGTKTKAVFE